MTCGCGPRARAALYAAARQSRRGDTPRACGGPCHVGPSRRARRPSHTSAPRIHQAIVIAEKVALSLATTADLRYLGNRLSHGALIPQFIWITDEGEIRVAGQQQGRRAVRAEHRDPPVGQGGGQLPAVRAP